MAGVLSDEIAAANLDAVEAGDVGKRLFKLMEEKGVVALAWGENGYRELTNSKRAVKKPEDLDGLKIRVVGSPIFIDTFITPAIKDLK